MSINMTGRWPMSRLPISQITPFTYKDGETYLSLLHRLSKYVTEQLHPNLRETVEHIVEEMEVILADTHAKYIEGVQDFQAIHDAFMEDVNSALMALNDNAVAALADDSETVFGAKLRELFASYSDFADLKTEIEEDFSDLENDMRDRTPEATGSSVTLYVSPTGNNNNNGLTETTALRTVNHAISRIPDTVRRNHTFRITLLPGTYNEDVRIANRVSPGHIIIEGQTDARQQYKINSFTADRVLGQMTVRNMMTMTEGEGTRSFEYRMCSPMMWLTNVEVTPDAGGWKPESRGILADYGTIIRVQGSDFSGKRYGMRSNYQSQIYSTNNTGTDNNIGIASRWGGTFHTYYNDVPQGDTPHSVNSGGTIVMGHGQILGDKPEVGLVDDLSYRGNTPVEQTWMFYDGMVNSYGVSGEIPSGSKFRLRFRVPTNNVAMTIKVDWTSQSTISGGQSVSAVAGVFFRGNEFTTKKLDTLNFSTGMGDAIDVVPRGSNLDFYVDINGARALENSWLCKVTIQTPDRTKMPFFAQVEILPAD